MSTEKQRTTLADILSGAADRIDAEDLPQTAEDVADFCDGARWATAQLRRIAGEANAEPAGDATPDWLADRARRYVPAVLPSVDRAAVLREGENALREKAGQLSELAEETMRRDLEETAQVWHEAATALAQLATEPPIETRPPDYTEFVDYKVVGDWGVDGAETAAGARAAVAKWLRAYPKCGARAEQRIVRNWEDGSEFYGPWTPLPEEG